MGLREARQFVYPRRGYHDFSQSLQRSKGDVYYPLKYKCPFVCSSVRFYANYFLIVKAIGMKPSQKSYYYCRIEPDLTTISSSSQQLLVFAPW